MRHRFISTAVLLLLQACGDSTAPDRGGAYTATLKAPAGQLDAAAVIELNGSGIATVTAIHGTVYTERSGDVVRVVVVTDVPATLSFGVQLSPGTRLPRGTVIEVADGDDQVRASLAGYSVRFAR